MALLSHITLADSARPEACYALPDAGPAPSQEPALTPAPGTSLAELEQHEKLLESARALGEMVGLLRMQMLGILKAFPEKPMPGDRIYQRYALMYDRVLEWVEVLQPELERYHRMAEASPIRQAFIISSLISCHDLDHEQAGQVTEIMERAYDEAGQAGVLRTWGTTAAWDNPSIEKRQQISREAFEAVRALLNPEQRDLFDRQYYPTDFIYTTQILSLYPR